MPFTFIIALIALAVLIIAVIAVPFCRDKFPPTATAIGAVLVMLLFLICASANIVGTRHVGIVTSFGKPTGDTLSNGLHWVAPWKTVTELDGAIQNDVYNGDNRINVRLGNNSTALADANTRWQIKQDAADELFVQYKTFDGIKSNLIDRNLRVALNEAFTQFDPLSSDPAKNNLNNVTTKALATLREKVGNQVEIIDISVPLIDYDDNVEGKINQLNAEKANTATAQQQIATNDAKREAAEKLANMPAPDLKIAIANCLNKMADAGINLNCFPIGGNVVPTLAVPNPVG